MPSGGGSRNDGGSANWVWLSVIPFGLGAWAPIYAGARVHNRRWVSLGALWSVIALAWVVAIARLPGVDSALAKQIVRTRNDTHGFTSVEDLGAALDLDGNLVEDLRSCVVFLPQSK